MIFFRRSLFDFFEDLLADMLIFITRCSIFLFFRPTSPPQGGVGGRNDTPY